MDKKTIDNDSANSWPRLPDHGFGRGRRMFNWFSQDAPENNGSWLELAKPANIGLILVLVFANLLYSINTYLPSSILPIAIAEIGGMHFYAFNTTLYLMASVIFSILLGKFLYIFNSRGAYLWGIFLFAVGSLLCATSAGVTVFLVARTIQGAGGGLLSGLAYELIQSQLPEKLWVKATTIVSGTYSTGILIGPPLGGFFVEIRQWRLAFSMLAAVSFIAAIIAIFTLKHQISVKEGGKETSINSLMLASSAVVLLSISSIVHDGILVKVLAALGALFMLMFLGLEKSNNTGVLPADCFQKRNPMGPLFFNLAILSFGATIENFVPLFISTTTSLRPFLAGLIGAVIGAGWMIGQLPTVTLEKKTSIDKAIIVGSVLATMCIALCGLQLHDHPSGHSELLWTLTYFGVGIGIGVAWPHITTRIMVSTSNQAEGNQASSAISTVQTLASSVGTAVVGLIINHTSDDAVRSASNVYLLIALLCIPGIFCAFRSVQLRPDRISSHHSHKFFHKPSAKSNMK